MSKWLKAVVVAGAVSGVVAASGLTGRGPGDAWPAGEPEVPEARPLGEGEAPNVAFSPAPFATAS